MRPRGLECCCQAPDWEASAGLSSIQLDFRLDIGIWIWFPVSPSSTVKWAKERVPVQAPGEPLQALKLSSLRTRYRPQIHGLQCLLSDISLNGTDLMPD